jgi:hypothetical protein
MNVLKVSAASVLSVVLVGSLAACGTSTTVSTTPAPSSTSAPAPAAAKADWTVAAVSTTKDSFDSTFVTKFTATNNTSAAATQCFDISYIGKSGSADGTGLGCSSTVPAGGKVVVSSFSTDKYVAGDTVTVTASF